MIGYIPDHDLRCRAGLSRPVRHRPRAAGLQRRVGAVNLARAGAGLAIVHDFALPAAPELLRVLPDQVRLTRTFWLVTHAGPRDARLERLTTLLRDGMRPRSPGLKRRSPERDSGASPCP